MIFKCACGALKTGQPYRASGVSPWVCEKCSPAKQSIQAGRRAQEAHGGRSYPMQEAK
jgi:hypothetical protein